MRRATITVLLLLASIANAELNAVAAELTDRNVLLVKFESLDSSRTQTIAEMDGVTQVTVLLGSIYKIEAATSEQINSVRSELYATGEIASIIDDELIVIDDSRGSFSPAGRSVALVPSAVDTSASYQAAAITPNDPEFINQWYLHSTGQYMAIPGLDINAPEAWEVTTGPQGSIVAVLGSGVDYTHEDLVGNLWTNPGEIPGNGIDDDENGYVDDVYGINTVRNDGNPADIMGMGTAIAGIIAARTNNAVGISGISWDSKILSCNYIFKAGPDFVSYFSDVIQCFDYVIRYKKKTNADITSLVYPGGDLGFRYFFREIAEELDSLGILLIIAGPGDDGLDLSTEFPLGYDLPNTIGVQALGRRIFSQFGGRTSSYGRRSIHSIAPGDHLLTTFPGFKPNHDAAAIYGESFEAGTAWQADPMWSFTSLESFSGTQSVAFSIGNESIAPEHVTSPVIDLSEYIDQPLGVSLKVKAPVLWGFDGVARRTGYVRVGITWPGLNYWEYLDGRAEESQGWRNFHFAFQPWIKDVISDPTQVQFRIEFSRDALEPAEVYVDNFSIGVVPPAAPSNDYVLYSGSAAAAAVVAGAAELVKAAKPGATASQIKNIITSTGFKPEIGDPTKYDRNNHALLLWDAVGNGVVNCSGVGMVRRTWPKIHVYEVAATGQESRLRAVSTDCGHAGAAPVFQRDDGGPAIVLTDDGIGHDLRPKDGDFSGSWSRTTPGLTALSLAGDVDLLTETLDSYNQVTEIPFEWRDMSNAPGGNVIPAVPFPIKFGNHPVGFQDNIKFFDISGTIRVQHIGIAASKATAESLAEVSNWNTRGSLDASGVPVGTSTWAISVLAAGSLIDPLSTEGRLRIDVLGAAPNREWVIQYHNVTVNACPTDQNLKAQVIFFENSSNIQMNFSEYSSLCGDSEWRPTVGIQYNDFAFTKYDGLITSETSLVFSAAAYDGNIAPIANTDVIEAIVKHGITKQIDLAPYFTDPDGDQLSYYLADPGLSPGFSISGSTLTTRMEHFTSSVGFVERYIYASDGEFAAKLNLRLQFESKSNFPPRLQSALPVVVAYHNDFTNVSLSEYFVDPEGDAFVFTPISFPEGYSISDNGYIGGRGSSLLANGEHEVEFEVSDGKNFASFKMTIDRRDERSNLLPELIAPIGTVNAEVGKMFRVSLENRFVDSNGDFIFFSFATNPPVPLSLITLPENMLGGVPDATWLAGSPHTISLQVRDTDFQWITHDFTIAVTDPNAAQAAPAAPPQSIEPAVEEVTVTASRSKNSGGGSVDLWLFAALLLSVLATVRRVAIER